MKPSYLIVIAILATLAAGYLLIAHAASNREIWIALGAWLLGFWFASGINGVRNSALDEAGDGEEEDHDEYEDYDEEESDDDEEWENDDMNGRD